MKSKSPHPNGWLFPPRNKVWDTQSRSCEDPLEKWALQQAKSIADKGEVSLSCTNNWWKLQCHVAGIPFSSSSKSIRECVQNLFSFATRGCQYIEIDG